MGNTPEPDEEDGTPDLVRSLCDGVFELLEDIGGKEFARRVFQDAFWFGYDGENPPIMPDNTVLWLLTRVEGARMMLEALQANDAFTRR
jgi:hypothetical protein